MKYITTDKAPSAVGPYSQAIKLDTGFLYISGQLGLVPETMQLPSTIEEQTIQSLKNVQAILESEEYNKNNVIKTTILLQDISHFGEVNKIYESFFDQHKPARSTFAVRELPKSALIEIEVIAFKYK